MKLVMKHIRYLIKHSTYTFALISFMLGAVHDVYASTRGSDHIGDELLPSVYMKANNAQGLTLRVGRNDGPLSTAYNDLKKARIQCLTNWPNGTPVGSVDYDQLQAKWAAYIRCFDNLFYEARKGNPVAAVKVSRFYRNLRFSDKENHRSINAWNIAKRFARLAAKRGEPDDYIELTALDYGAGREMVEHTRWRVKSLSQGHLAVETPYLLRETNCLESANIDKDTMRMFKGLIDRSYVKSWDARLAKANMYLKGYFGAEDQVRANALIIAYQEMLLCDYTKDTKVLGGCRMACAWVLYDFVSQTLGYDLSRDAPWCDLTQRYNFCPMLPRFDPLRFMRECTELLEYYKLEPLKISKKVSLQNEVRIHLDLHECSKSESIVTVVELLKYMRFSNHKKVSALVITGKGNHSPGQIAILKPAIHKVLEEAKSDPLFPIEYDLDNGEGAFNIRLKKQQGSV